MKVYELLRDVKILDMSPDTLNTEVTNPVCDSGKVTNGSIFTSLVGENHDGHEYISDAVKKGAAVIVTEREVTFDTAKYIRVPDSHYAFSSICNAYYKNPTKDMILIGVTGTNGKSSAVNIISQILNGLGIKCAEIGTIGYSMTTPTPDILYPTLYEMKKAGTKCVAMEISSHGLYNKRVAPLSFNFGIFTNLTPEHLDFHRNTEEYFKAKSTLFDRCGVGIFCANDEYAVRCMRESGRLKYLYGMGKGDYSAENAEYTVYGSEFDLQTANKRQRFKIPLIGSFQILNSLSAVCCINNLGVGLDEISNELKKLKPIPGRLEEVVHSKGNFKIFIDYAHTPDAMQNAINAVRAIMTKREKLTVIFGCGGERDRTKRPKMGAIASLYADKAILTSDNPRNENEFSIITEIMSGWQTTAPRIIIPIRQEAVEYAVLGAKENDVLLFLGKGHEKYIQDSTGIHEYNEKTAIIEALSGI